MAAIALKEKTRQPDRYLALTRDDQGEIVEGADLTKAQYDSLALKDAGAPTGVSKEDWESGKVWAAGGVRDYGNGQHTLALGEFAELPDRYEVGAETKDGMPVTVTITKSVVIASRIGGLSIAKIDGKGWPDAVDIVSISEGILTTSSDAPASAE